MTPLTEERIRTSLTDPTGPAISHVKSLAKQWDENSIDPSLRGLAGLYLFCAAAEPSIKKRVHSLKEARQYLSERAVKQTMLVEYEVPPDLVEDLDDLHFYEYGTTSIILRSGYAYVLKIIKPWFWRVESISCATKNYKKRFGNLGSFCPDVRKCHARWIFMKFVEGKPLTAYIKEHLHPLNTAPETELFLHTVQKIFAQLCNALATCADQTPKIHHLDLSPDNIIISPEGTPIKITLIDFGVNSLLLTHLANGDNFTRANSFIPPELRMGAKGNELSDVYSLGLILLEMLSRDSLRTPDASVQLDSVWQSFPELAETIEDTIDGDPSNRLLDADPELGYFRYLLATVEHSAMVHRELHLKKPRIYDAVKAIINSAIPVDPLEKAYQKWITTTQDSRPPLFWVLSWGFLAQITNLVVLFFIFWTVVDPLGTFHNSRLCDELLPKWCVTQMQVPPLPQSWGLHFWHRINGYSPGRLVALTFALIFAKFYSEIFGSITLRYFKSAELRKRAWVPEVAMRAIPIAGFFALAWGIVFDPKAWTFCAGFGLLVVGVNNWQMFGFCQWALGGNRTNLAKASSSQNLDRSEARSSVLKSLVKLFSVRRPDTQDKRILQHLPSSPFVIEQLRQFKRWSLGMFIYSASLVIVGLCMRVGLAKDEWLYAAFAGICLNMLTIYRIHCYTAPPDLRTAFGRIVFRLRRLDSVLCRTDGRHTPLTAMQVTEE
jgi:serine/threonine protein kinase